ncbi:MAG: Uma2 family endonuclease [Bacteroidota bacterium]
MTSTLIQKFAIEAEVPLILNFEFSDDAFFEFCQLNRNLNIEREADGTIIVLSPSGFKTGNFNAELNAEVTLWNRSSKLGKTGDSSTGYTLPNGSVRSPDVSWVSNKQLNAIDSKLLVKFAPLCPDFVIEILSPSDSLKKTQVKMQEYIDNGCRLGWLIDPANKKIYIYRLGREIEIIDSFQQVLSGEDVLPGFELVLSKLI